MKSKRTDGRGHWARGKRRSTLTDEQAASVRAKLRSAVRGSSAKAVARILGVSDMCVARIVTGEDMPSERTAQLVAERLTDQAVR